MLLAWINNAQVMLKVVFKNKGVFLNDIANLNGKINLYQFCQLKIDMV